MTIELTLDDLVEVTENAQRFGACVFKATTSEGDPVWIAVTAPQKQPRTRRPRGAAAEPAISNNTAPAQPLPPLPGSQQAGPNSGAAQ